MALQIETSGSDASKSVYWYSLLGTRYTHSLARVKAIRPGVQVIGAC